MTAKDIFDYVWRQQDELNKYVIPVKIKAICLPYEKYRTVVEFFLDHQITTTSVARNKEGHGFTMFGYPIIENREPEIYIAIEVQL